MKTIHFNDVINWIFRQPDDKIVKWKESEYNDDCGCVMVQYGKAVELNFIGCGTRHWRLKTGECVDLSIGTFRSFRPDDREQHAYKEIKEFLMGRSHEKTT